MNWFKYLSRGITVAGLLAVELPKILADGKVTVKEMTDFFVKVAGVFGFPVSLDIPTDMNNFEFSAKADFPQT